MAEPFAGALPSPLDLTRFAQVEAASSTLPAAFQKEKPPKGWFFFLEQGTGAEPALTAWEEYELFFDYFPKLSYNLGKTLIYQAFQPFPYFFFDAKSNPFWSYHAEL